MEDPNNESTTTTTEEKAVPYERFQTVTKGRREALARVAELEDQVRQLQGAAGTVEQLTTKLADVEGRLSAQASEWQAERALWQAGLTDPDGIEVARMFYARIEPDKRPPMAEWLRTLKAEPDKAPRALAAYLGSVADAPAPATTPEPTRAPPPNPNRGAATSSAAAAATAGGFDAATIKRLADEARRTGDYSKLREAMPAIRASLRG